MHLHVITQANFPLCILLGDVRKGIYNHFFIIKLLSSYLAKKLTKVLKLTAEPEGFEQFDKNSG